MKKVFLIIFVLSFLLIIYLYFSQTKQNNKSLDNEAENTNINLKPTISKVEDSSTFFDYNTSQITLTDSSVVKIFSNLDTKLTSKDAMNKYNCNSLINGGFYTKDNKHVGLFISEGVTLSNSISHNLFNGYLSITSQGKIDITNYPKINSYFSIQSGPLLIYNQNELKLNLESDKNARRIISFTTTLNEQHFMVIYDKNSPLNGPKLSELPKLLNKLENQNSFIIEDAINLDGGSHSALLSNDLKLSEISPLGSFICITN